MHFRNIVVMALSMVFALLSPGTAAAQTSVKIGPNETYAFASGVSGSKFIIIQLITGLAQGTRTTLLFYLLYDENTNTERYGTGYIPNSALTGNLPAGLVLEVDTSSISTPFANYDCDLNVPTFPPPCTRVPGGVLSVTWNRNGEYWGTQTRQQREIFPAVTMFSSFSLRAFDAVATVNAFLNETISPIAGQIGNAQTGNISIERH